MNKENFGSPTDNPFAFGASVALFLGAFYFTKVKESQSDPAAFHLWNHRVVYLLNNPAF